MYDARLTGEVDDALCPVRQRREGLPPQLRLGGVVLRHHPANHAERDRHHADRYPKWDAGAESRAADGGEVGDESRLGDVAEAAVGVGLEEGVVVEAQHLRLDLRDVALQVLLVCGGAAVRSAERSSGAQRAWDGGAQVETPQYEGPA